jgi:hypothetical protein
MELILKLDKVITAWRERISSAGAYYAEIKTTKVWHERAAVVEENDRNITVEYPVKKQAGSKITWSIRKDVIPRGEVIWMRVYED